MGSHARFAVAFLFRLLTAASTKRQVKLCNARSTQCLPATSEQATADRWFATQLSPNKVTVPTDVHADKDMSPKSCFEIWNRHLVNRKESGPMIWIIRGQWLVANNVMPICQANQNAFLSAGCQLLASSRNVTQEMCVVPLITPELLIVNKPPSHPLVCSDSWQKMSCCSCGFCGDSCGTWDSAVGHLGIRPKPMLIICEFMMVYAGLGLSPTQAWQIKCQSQNHGHLFPKIYNQTMPGDSTKAGYMHHELRIAGIWLQ